MQVKLGDFSTYDEKSKQNSFSPYELRQFPFVCLSVCLSVDIMDRVEERSGVSSATASLKILNICMKDILPFTLLSIKHRDIPVLYRHLIKFQKQSWRKSNTSL